MSRLGRRLENCPKLRELEVLQMDEQALSDAIVELRKQKEHLDQVILMLETLAQRKPRRGRPPKLLSDAMKAVEGEVAQQSSAKRPRKKAKKQPPKIPTD